MEPLIAVTTLKAYDQKAVLSAVEPNAKKQRAGDHWFYLNDRDPFRSLAFLDDHTYLLSRSDRLETFLKQKGAKTEGSLAPKAERRKSILSWRVRTWPRSPESCRRTIRRRTKNPWSRFSRLGSPG